MANHPGLRVDRFKALSRADIKAEWIVEGLISPGGWTFLVGETKVGKSILMIQLCESLQNGDSFLGMKTKQHNCLYIQADAGLIEWKTQIERYAPDGFSWTAHQLRKGWLDNTTSREHIYNLIWGIYPEDSPFSKVLKHQKFDFIIFDCLHAMTNEDLNTPTGSSTVMQRIENLVTYYNEEGEEERVHYLLIHHPNATVKRGATAGSGHKSFSALCTTKLTLLPNTLILEGSKLVGKKEIELERNDDGSWSVIGEKSEVDYKAIFGE